MELAVDTIIGEVQVPRNLGTGGGVSRNSSLTGQLGDTQESMEGPHKTGEEQEGLCIPG